MYVVPLTRRSPRLTRGFDRRVDEALERFLVPSCAAELPAVRVPALDVAETDSGYTVQMELPGVSKQDIQIAVEGRRVSIKAQASSDESKALGDRVVHRERAAVDYARSFVLPTEVDAASSNAKFDNGVLTLTLAKRADIASRLTVQ